VSDSLAIDHASPTAPAGGVDAAAEYAAVRDDVGLLDRTDWGVLEVTGRDRAAFLHAMFTNDIKGLAPGQGCAAAFLNAHGKVQALVAVWALEDRLLVVTPPGRAGALLEGLDRYLFAEKAALRDATGELALFLLAGPRAPALVARLAGVALPEAPWAHVAGSVAGVEVRLVRGGGETGEPEGWVAAPATAAAAVRAALVEAGARPVGPEAFEALRIEAGTPVLGRDVDDTVLLPEIPFLHLVSYTKGCYLGQEVVVRIRDRGHVNRHLRGLVIEAEAVPAPGAAVRAGDADVGRVTSAAWCPRRARPLALAYVRRQHAEPGTRLAVRAAGGDLPAVVSALPFPR